MTKPTALGIMSGIGSMLCAAQQEGFTIVGNVEHRSYFWTGTFEANFPKAFFVKQLDNLSTKVDVIFAHPSCGNHSSLNTTGRSKNSDAGDIPPLIEYLQRIRPTFFVIDNLAKMLNVVSIKVWAKSFPEYDLFPEFVSNYHYGNAQLKRTRLIIVGAKKKERFVFVPGEVDKKTTVKEIIGDLCFMNHEEHVLDSICSKATHMIRRGKKSTWREVREYFKTKPEGYVLRYHNSDSDKKSTNLRPGFKKSNWNGHCYVLIGTNPCLHPLRNLPFTIRERARLMGFPDTFSFEGVRYDGKGYEWDHSRNANIIKQTGKAVPLQFIRYLSKQIKCHMNKKSFKSSGERIHEPNLLVSEAKKWYCKNVGYSNQKKACKYCWLDC